LASLELKFGIKPMTLNHANRIVRFGSRCGIAPTQKYKIWKSEVNKMLLAQNKQIKDFSIAAGKFDYLTLEIEFNFDSVFTKTGTRRKKHLDIENISKNLTDLIFKRLNIHNSCFDDSFITELHCTKKQSENNVIFYRLNAY